MSPIPTVRLIADHIDHGGALHGGGRSLIALTEALRAAGADAAAVVVHRASSLGRQLAEEGKPIRFLGRSPYDPRIARELVRICRDEGADILHLTDFAACTWGRVALARSAAATVVHVRSHHSPHQPRGFPKPVEWAYRALAPLTDRAIVVSESVRRFAIDRMGFDAEQVRVLHNPLGTSVAEEVGDEVLQRIRRRHEIPEEVPVIGTVTRFHAAKGNRYLVDALARIRERHPEAMLVLVGEGPEEDMLRQRARDQGLGDRIVFAGYQEDVSSYYHLFDVCVMPSIEEGFGNVAVESMTAGTPVVASHLGGLGEIISHDENGLLVPPADPAAIAQAVTGLLDDASRAAGMSARARARAADFSMDAYLERLLSVYEEARTVRNARVRKAS